MDAERLLEILEKLGLLEKSFLPSHRRYIRILCPFHSETEPSCSIVLENGYKARPVGFTYCFSCGKKFRNYVHLLSALSEHPDFKDKFKSKLGFEFKPKLIKEKEFPIHDMDGNIVYYQEIWFNPATCKKEVRYCYETKDGRKYTIPGKKYPYGLDTIIHNKNKANGVVIFESPQDADALRFIAKDQAVLATCGANTWHNWWVDILKWIKEIGFTKACIIPQADDAGRKWAIEMFGRCRSAGLETWISFVCEKEGVKDISELIESFDEDDPIELIKLLSNKILKYREDEIPYLYFVAPNDLNKITITRMGDRILSVMYQDGIKSFYSEVVFRKGDTRGIEAHVILEDNTKYNNKVSSYLVNFSRPRSFDTFKNALDKEVDVNFSLAELIKQEVLKALRIIDCDEIKEEEAEEPIWLIEPLVYKSAYTLLYAPKASGKTTLSCFLTMIIQNGCKNFYPFKFQRCKVLYLDWENPRSVMAYKMKQVAQSLGITDPEYPIYYEVTSPLTSIASDVRKVILKYNIEFIVIDSLVPSLGGMSSNDTGGASLYHSVIKEWTKLGCGVLILTHVSKKDIKDGSEPMWIGSVMFGNFAKIVWQASSISTSEDINITLKCIYNNYGRLPNPFDITFSFNKDGSIKPVVNRDTINELALPLTERIKRVLKDGAKTLQEIGLEIYSSDEEYEKRKAILKNTLAYLKKKGVVILKDHKYGLVANIKEDDVPF